MYTNTLFFSEFHIIPTWNIHTNEHSAPKSSTFWNLEILSLWYISIYSFIDDYGMDFVIDTIWSIKIEEGASAWDALVKEYY